MILRDTSIREPNLPSKDCGYFRNSFGMYGIGNNSPALPHTATHQLPTTLIASRDCNSPYSAQIPGGGSYQLSGSDISSGIPGYLAASGSIGLGSRESSSGGILRESNNRLASHRFMPSSLDQRIIKQSSEDCRRLLQQVRCMLRSS